jgi:hypothetical protein
MHTMIGLAPKAFDFLGKFSSEVSKTVRTHEVSQAVQSGKVPMQYVPVQPQPQPHYAPPFQPQYPQAQFQPPMPTQQPYVPPPAPFVQPPQARPAPRPPVTVQAPPPAPSAPVVIDAHAENVMPPPPVSSESEEESMKSLFS